MRALALAAVLLLAPAAASAQALPPDLARQVHAYERAQIEGDGAALEAIIADDFILVGGDGGRVGKASHIAEFTAPELDLEPVVLRDVVEHVWTDGAALGATVDLSGTFDGAPFRQTLRYMDVWALRDGQWRVVYGQATLVPAAD